MKLLGSISQGSGAINEDGFGIAGRPGKVSAAWIFDGVTGINARAHLGTGSDAQWLVSRAHERVTALAAKDLPLNIILEDLVEGLIADWAAISRGLDLPVTYDPPAACLILVKHYPDGWHALRLGDSCLLARGHDGESSIFAASPNNDFDHWLTRESRRRREQGFTDIKALMAEFAPALKAGRARRNRPDGYSILECSRDALAMPEFIALGEPAEILLCTDGYYRAVDIYRMFNDGQLMDESRAGVDRVLSRLRSLEAGDTECRIYPRFKPADDATAVMLAA